jgi:hypothetical protein
LLASALFGLAGCGSADRHGEADHDHVGHVVPEHKPKSFPEAVRRLREYSERCTGGIRDPQATNVPDEKAMIQALDIAHWLPEIAADSDMPEEAWNRVDACSAALVSAFEEMLLAKSSGAQQAANRASAEIGKLERLLRAADTAWSLETGKPGTVP